MALFRRGVILTAALALVLSTAVSAFAADPSSREKDLMIMIEALKERLADLESKLEQDPALAQRVTDLEGKLDGKKDKNPADFRVYWKSGLNLASEDGHYKLKIGGRIQNDWAWIDQDANLIADFGSQDDGTEFRRARLYVSGTIYDNISFKAQYDFTDGDADFKDVWIALGDIPGIGNLKVGHFKEPFGLEQLTSSKYITFMERSLPDVFTPERNTGAMIYNTAFDERLLWALGVFRNTDDYGDRVEDGAYAVTGRLAGTPWKSENGLLHLGAAASWREPDADASRFRQRPEAHLSEFRYVDTGVFGVEEEFRWGLEAAMVYGPFSVQGEYMAANMDTTALGDRDFDGWYAMASWFLTGESRPYKASEGAFDRVKPKHNFNPWAEDGGWGAWELALRYSTLDLNDGPIWGGEEDNITAAINWYLNPNTRVMFNYVHGEIDYPNGRVFFDPETSGDVDIFQTRFQIDF